MTHFVLAKKDEELFGHEVPYLSAIGELIYLANCIRPNIAFSINLLARYSFVPTRRHWNGIKHILRYLWVYFTQGNQSNNCLDMQIQDIFQIHIKVGHKQGMCLIIMVLLFHGDFSNKQWWLHQQIIQKYWQFMKQVVNVYS